MPEEFYKGIDFTTLELLRKRCQTDESQHTAKLMNLDLVSQDGDLGTRGTYASVPLGDFKFGLIMDEYQNIADANVIETNRGVQGHKHLFRGKARIGDRNKKVTVFRK